jgi:hypothetical protein
MAQKEDYWRTRILRDGEKRYIDLVIRPALEDLDATRTRLAEKMPDDQSGDNEIIALFQAEIERINAVEARLRAHMGDTIDRFSRLRSQPSRG